MGLRKRKTTHALKIFPSIIHSCNNIVLPQTGVCVWFSGFPPLVCCTPLWCPPWLPLRNWTAVALISSEFYLVQVNTTLMLEISCSNLTIKLNVGVILKQDVTSLHNRKSEWVCVCAGGGAHTVELRGVVQGLLWCRRATWRKMAKGEGLLLLASGAYPPSMLLLLWKWLEPTCHDILSGPVSVIVSGVTYYPPTKVGLRSIVTRPQM